MKVYQKEIRELALKEFNIDWTYSEGDLPEMVESEVIKSLSNLYWMLVQVKPAS